MQSNVYASGRVSEFLSSSLFTKSFIKGDTVSGNGKGYYSRISNNKFNGFLVPSGLKKGTFPFDNN
jgi:hypothetical protein